MKKIILFAITMLAFISCSDDDNNHQAPKTKLLQNISANDQILSAIEYDEMKIRQVTFSDFAVYKFIYSDEKIIGIDVEGEIFNEATCSFFYDGNGKVNKLTVNNEQVNVVYNIEDNSYTCSRNNSSYRVYLDDDDDLLHIVNSDASPLVSDFLFEYEQGKGSMFNANRVSTCVALALPFDAAFFATLAKKPLKMLRQTNMGMVYNTTYQNVLTNDGFIDESTWSNSEGESGETSHYNYFEK